MSKIKSSNQLRISGKNVIECPDCKVESKLTEWDTVTFDQCYTREMKRSYISLADKRAYRKQSDTHYMCPSCKKYIKGYMLRIKGQLPHML